MPTDKVSKEIVALLRQARKNGGKPRIGYIKQEDGGIHVLLLADSSEFVYRQLKKHEGRLLSAYQSLWPHRNIVKVSVVPRIKNEYAQRAIELGGTFRVFAAKRGDRERETTADH